MKIVAASLRNYKCYQGTTLVPLFCDGDKFVGFIGENGVGKSAILEALHSFFTNQYWIRNKTGKQGVSECGVAPIVYCDEQFLQKNKFTSDNVVDLKKYSETIKKKLQENNIGVQVESIYFSCMFFQDGSVDLFEGNQIVREKEPLAKKIRALIISYFKYIYIGAEVDIDGATDINSKTVELIRGSGIVGEIEEKLRGIIIEIEGGANVSISELINKKVISYLDEQVVKKLQEVDADYNYKNLRTGAQSSLSEKLISELAVQALFSNRELTKKTGEANIGISDMSSGQRRKALFDFISVIIHNLDPNEQEKIILAMDEPEISVGSSARIQQFEKLRRLAISGANILFTTHWYGWIAQLIEGSSVLIKEADGVRNLYQSTIDNFPNLNIPGTEPYEMRMMFDFLSSLGSWAEVDQNKKFVVCEGPTDRNFITKHFPDYKVIPVRASGEVIRLCKLFSDYYLKNIKKPSNIVFLIDTDPGRAQDIADIDSVNLKRISRDPAGLIKIMGRADNFAEKCEMEDLLSPRPFLEALRVSGVLLDQIGQEFIKNLVIRYADQTGVRAFGLDDVGKATFKSIYKDKFKLRVSESYQPAEEEKNIFINSLKIF